MALITITIKNLPEIKRTFEQAPVKMTKEIRTAVSRVIEKIQADAMKLAPVNKQSGGGNLRQSIKSRMSGAASGIVEVTADYGAAVNDGTRPHVIVIKNKKCLANKRMGQFFGKKVNHPGTKAQPFFTDAIENNNSFINEQFVKAVENAIK